MSTAASTRTRVLYIANAGKIGGGARVLMDLMLNLDPTRYEPVLVAPERGQITDWAIQAGIRHHVSPAGDWLETPALARRSLSLLRIILRERAAIVHAAAPTCYRAAGIAARLAGAARVCHLGFPPEPGELQRSFVSPPDAVIGCYEGQARDHIDEIRQIRPDCRVVGICNGIDTRRFNPDCADLSVRRGAPQVVAILGHISAVKGHPEFVEAAALLALDFPDARFVVIGGETVQTGLRAALEQRVAALGIQHRFDFLGFRNDVAALLSAIDVVALPSHAEGLPLAALEAMACGKPVVATPVGGVSEAIVEGVTGTLVPPNNPHILAAAVGKLLREPDLATRMGTAGRVRICERFSVEIFARAVQNVYREASAVYRRAAA
jgi:glycosyltransferase involved in cell wall biosynthesis